MNSFDPYEELGVERDADDETIEQAARSHARRTHPDRDGGDAAAFARGRRALTVLRDPDKREQFDRTGKDDERPESTLHANAMEMISARFASLLYQQGLAIETTNFTERVQRILEAERTQAYQSIAGEEANAFRLQKIAARLKMKAVEGRVNFLGRMLEMNIQRHEQNRQVALRAIETMTLAIGLLDDFSYEVDPPPPPTASVWAGAGVDPASARWAFRNVQS